MRKSYPCWFWLVCLCGVLVGITGCDEVVDLNLENEGDNDWVGTWSLESVDGQDWGTNIPLIGGDIEDKWVFHDNGTWELEATLTALEETGSFKGTYTITDTTFSMSSPDPEFTTLSDFISIDVTIEITDVEGEVEGEIVGGDGEVNVIEHNVEVEIDVIENPETTGSSTGTWIRDGNILTLTLSNDQVLVFKKL